MAFLILTTAVSIAAFVLILLLYQRELIRMSHFLDTRDEHSNLRLTTEIPLPGTSAMIRSVNSQLDRFEDNRRTIIQAEKDFQNDLVSLSHDIRTPLTGAKGYLQLACREVQTNIRNEYLNSASERLEAMQIILNQMFVYVKSLDDEMPVQLEYINAIDIMREVIAGAYPKFLEADIYPLIDISESGFKVNADRDALRRIFDNVIENIISHGVSPVSIIQKGRSVEFINAVSKSDAFDVDKVFERFYRGDCSRSCPGSGLGLSVVSNLCASMHVDVSASYEAGTFRLKMVFP